MSIFILVEQGFILLVDCICILLLFVLPNTSLIRYVVSMSMRLIKLLQSVWTFGAAVEEVHKSKKFVAFRIMRALGNITWAMIHHFYFRDRVEYETASCIQAAVNISPIIIAYTIRRRWNTNKHLESILQDV